MTALLAVASVTPPKRFVLPAFCYASPEWSLSTSIDCSFSLIKSSVWKFNLGRDWWFSASSSLMIELSKFEPLKWVRVWECFTLRLEPFFFLLFAGNLCCEWCSLLCTDSSSWENSVVDITIDFLSGSFRSIFMTGTPSAFDYKKLLGITAAPIISSSLTLRFFMLYSLGRDPTSLRCKSCCFFKETLL